MLKIFVVKIGLFFYLLGYKNEAYLKKNLGFNPNPKFLLC